MKSINVTDMNISLSDNKFDIESFYETVDFISTILLRFSIRHFLYLHDKEASIIYFLFGSIV